MTVWLIAWCRRKQNDQPIFTTKDTKITKLKNKISETFVAFVSFVVRKYFVECRTVGVKIARGA